MFTSVIDLHDFYQTPLGQKTKRALRARLDDLWPSLKGERILTLGYGVPLLRPLLQQAAAVYAFMPAAQGAAYGPREGPNVSCLVNFDALPLPDNSIDRVIAVHALEGLAEPEPLLREVWRVLKSGGRFLLIVPNRRGLWAHNDHTPFGNGQPYSSTQIKRVLNNQGFLVERLHHALYMPPSSSRLNLSLADKTEIIAARLFPVFGGVLMIESGKQLYAPLAPKAQARLRLVLPLSLPTAPPLPTRVAI
jgi:SAM-dependent methyltransferase